MPHSGPLISEDKLECGGFIFCLIPYTYQTSDIAQFCISLNHFQSVIPCFILHYTKTISSIPSVCVYLNKENTLLMELTCSQASAAP